MEFERCPQTSSHTFIDSFVAGSQPDKSSHSSYTDITSSSPRAEEEEAHGGPFVGGGWGADHSGGS